MKNFAITIVSLFLSLGLAGTPIAEEGQNKFPGTIMVPAGKFEMGSHKSLMELNPTEIFHSDRHMLGPEDPAHEVILDAYLIEMYEVTNGDYKKYLKLTGSKKPPYWDDPGFNGPAQPVVGVSWKSAQKYCHWKKMRLPTEAEWEKAARGKRPVKYPWGNEAPGPSRLNYNNLIKKPADVGSYLSGKSDYGVYDMSGNVSEWVFDWHDPEYYLFSPMENPTGPKKGQYKVIRGGNWRSGAEDVRLTYRNATVPKIRNTTIGFRCAASADRKLIGVPRPSP